MCKAISPPMCVYHQSVISRTESASSLPSLSFLKKIANALGTSLQIQTICQKKPFDIIKFISVGVENQARTNFIRKDCCVCQARQTTPNLFLF